MLLLNESVVGGDLSVDWPSCNEAERVFFDFVGVVVVFSTVFSLSLSARATDSETDVVPRKLSLVLSVFSFDRDKLCNEDDSLRVAVNGLFWFSFFSSRISSNESSMRSDSMWRTSWIDSVMS